ncbi:aspartate-semialdehyde dehydrogenase [Calderihabitans maritimus]|uniref:Aspartate-semialdehyde dehydrogenase n=1 Tax=Calderihabitans maritimus TaxID=1246530 RepID=A0A1Z5HQG9_9FIRM|nr:aspartate-semialdehyde dehydrogenase [Calderihabitans maritimus]GAW91776.1 aspartate-semialdehyde dehydrogenase [Calderihabitans maritimus]
MTYYNVAVVGTGAVGKTILEVLEERNFPVGSLKVLATKRSAGKKVVFKGEELVIEETRPESFKGVDLALFAGGGASKEFAHEAVKYGAVVIDNSSAFRLEPDVPLVVPEVNPEDVKWHKGIIANPNCSTIIMVVALKPLHDAARIRRVIVSTYQAVSGAGQEAIDELLAQTKQILNNEPISPQVFPYQIAFNIIPHIDRFVEKDYTREEMKMVNETRKMFHDETIAISATTVRIPVIRSHSEAITIETERKLTPEEARELLSQAPGVVVVDNPREQKYPMPIDASGRDEVFVGRIREDISSDKGLCLWVVADQLRKGAATNAVQIGELLIENNLI